MSEEPAYTQDPVWSAWKIKSFDDYYAGIPDLSFNQRVSKDVTAAFDVIKKLVIYSYYEYQFLDAAMIQASLCFELALKIRYKEVEDKDPSKTISLHDLILWAGKRLLFEDDVEIILGLKDLRNSLAHPKRQNQYGFVAIQLIQRVVDVINGLYEDPILRQERLLTKEKINCAFLALTEAGAELHVGETLIPIYCARLLYLDNASKRKIYHWLFWPVFDLKWHDGTLDESSPYIIQSSGYVVENGEYVIQPNNSKGVVALRNMKTEEKIAAHEKWSIALRDEKLVKFSIGTHISKFQSEIISRTHQR